MRKDAFTHHVLTASLLVKMAVVFHKRKFAMESMIVRTTRPLMRLTNDAPQIPLVQRITSNVPKQIFAWSHIGCAMVITIVEIIQMKTQFIVLRELAHRIVSVVQTTDVFQLLGIVMVIRIALKQEANQLVGYILLNFNGFWIYKKLF